MALKNNTWKLNQWYDQSVAGNTTYSSTVKALYIWGNNQYGALGQNNNVHHSSPVQIPGTGWRHVNSSGYGWGCAATKTDGTLWAWGYNSAGQLGLNEAGPANRSSPCQIPGTTWSDKFQINFQAMLAIKTDGELWVWGNNNYGQLGQNDTTKVSSPVQIPGSWSDVASNLYSGAAIKTDGTLWAWGYNYYGQLGQNNRTNYSSPRQIPGTTWRSVHGSGYHLSATKTDGSLWSWGRNAAGALGTNQGQNTDLSSPVQIPGSWTTKVSTMIQGAGAINTDGELYMWGNNTQGRLGQNDTTSYSSPRQVPGTWSDIASGQYGAMGMKTDGTAWSWGTNNYGAMGINDSPPVRYSSPVQIPGSDWSQIGSSQTGFQALKML